jgi:hypothetical protein
VASTTLAILLKISIPNSGGLQLRYQNYNPTAQFSFNSELYDWLGFEIQTYTKSDLSIGSDDTQIAMRNTSALRAQLKLYDDFRRSVVDVHHVRVGATAPTISYKLIVSHCAYDGGLVMFTLRSPTSALVGPLVSRYFSSSDFPELPFYKPQL